MASGKGAEYEERFGKGGAALADALDRLPLHIRKIPLKLYFDNYFTSLPLIKHLTLCGYGATGTIRDNRLPKSCPAAAVKSMKALVRGSVSVCGDTSNGISVVRWKDNSVVTVASNMAGSGPLQTVKRWSSKEKKMVQVPQPHCVSEHNKKMGGTDIMDQSINAYRTNIRIKKWWWAIFSWMLDAAVQNTWLVHRTKDEHASLLDVRRQISTTLLTRCQRDVSGAGTEGATGPPRGIISQYIKSVMSV
ncbi:Chimeric ERCC6-PGBD3 protein [Amphibalanus amphitrite]|uniref:Chimeric ERCC6-PGBD3 protein n=1 Tax=Amphibalanus amphitrite TaxID=1232801 RepID=A0A6A4W3A1_AMPAM|nr:Chimeric ERCC6-PGBD3 protein [Amphibalanus amphitrite]